MLIASDDGRCSGDGGLRSTDRCGSSRWLEDTKRASGRSGYDIHCRERPSANGYDFVVERLNLAEEAVGRYRQLSGGRRRK